MVLNNNLLNEPYRTNFICVTRYVSDIANLEKYVDHVVFPLFFLSDNLILFIGFPVFILIRTKKF